MKKLSSVVCFLCVLLTAPSVFSQDHEETPLEKEMEAMNDSWKAVRRAVKEPSQFAGAAKKVGTIIEHTKKALEMKPMLLADQDGDEAKNAFMAGYQKEMKELLALFEDLKLALETGDQEAAEALVGKINDAKKHGHREYKPKDD